MRNLVVNLTGSSGNYYPIDIRLSDGSMKLQCPCQAGENGMFCKHVGQIMEGDLSSVENKSEQAELAELLQTSEAKNAITHYSSLRGALESQLKAEALAKKAASKIKKEIFDLLSGQGTI